MSYEISDELNNLSLLFGNGKLRITFDALCGKCGILEEKATREVSSCSGKIIYQCDFCHHRFSQKYNISVEKVEKPKEYNPITQILKLTERHTID